MTLVDDTVVLDDGTLAPGGEPEAVPALVTMAELARRCGVSRQAVHKQVKELVAAKLIKTVKRGRSVMVDPVQYEAARESIAEPSRALAPAPDQAGGTYHAHRNDAARFDAELKGIKLRQLRGELIEAASLQEALADCGARIGRHWDLIAQWSEEISAIAAKGGAKGVRSFLKEKAIAGRQAIADELVRTAARAGEAEGSDVDKI